MTNLKLVNELRNCANEGDGEWSHSKICELMRQAAFRIEALALRNDLNEQELSNR